MLPIDSTDPVERIDSTDPREPIDSTDPFDRPDRQEPSAVMAPGCPAAAGPR
jgi:hypothetical protein